MAEKNEEKNEFIIKASIWMKELRAPFFTATIVPVFLGAIIAWSSSGAFNTAYFILSLIAALCLHAGTNMVNDYFDFKSGCDIVNKDFVSPFTGGSRLLPQSLLKPRNVHTAALLSFSLASLIGVFLAFQTGWIILFLGVIGILSGYFYTTQLATRVVGEFFVGLNFGPLMVLGSYYVQTQKFALEPLAASIPIGLLIANVLWINEIPDYTADKYVGKNTCVVRLGRKRAADVYTAIMIATYVSIALGVGLKLMPVVSLISLATIPMALKAIKIAREHYGEPSKLVPANASTITIHLLTGILLALGYVIHHIFMV
ncbi:MAG: 1,4-dihydroxy-2-naphthoate octaprenyltransferase [Candidatus Bathyarchaeia archaeon]